MAHSCASVKRLGRSKCQSGLCRTARLPRPQANSVPRSELDLDPSHLHLGNLSDSEVKILASNAGLDVKVGIGRVTPFAPLEHKYRIQHVAGHWVAEAVFMGSSWYIDPAGQPPMFSTDSIPANIRVQSTKSVMCGNLLLLIAHIFEKHPDLSLRPADPVTARQHMVALLSRFLLVVQPVARGPAPWLISAAQERDLEGNDVIARIFTVDFKGGEEWMANAYVVNYFAVLAPYRSQNVSLLPSTGPATAATATGTGTARGARAAATCAPKFNAGAERLCRRWPRWGGGV